MGSRNRYPRQAKTGLTEVRPNSPKIVGCVDKAVCVEDIQHKVQDVGSGQVFNKMEVVDGGNTCGVSPMVTSLGESRDSEGQDHSGFCQVTGVTGGVFAQNEQGSNCVVDIPSECVVPGTETSTMSMVNKSLMQSENVQCKVISNAKAIGRSCYKVGDEGQILKVKLAGQCVSLLVDTGSQVSVLTPQVYEALFT